MNPKTDSRHQPSAVVQHLMIWRSPLGQPRWTRPVLLCIATCAGILYGWAINQDIPEFFYGAAARSMSLSWHNFFFGAFDPLSTITVDKLPGALWMQAIFVHIFGFHIWSIAAPQAIEGVLTVLVLYRAVRRLCGPTAGIIAAGSLAISPATVLLNRGNFPDTLLTLLLTLAVDAASHAVATGRLRPLLLSGMWVGLAFQAKMSEAWIVVLPITLACCLAYRPPLHRMRHIGAFCLLAIVLSLSWMSVVSLVPSHDRPYVDGSNNNSVFSQVFDYNGIARFSSASIASSLGGHVAPFINAESPFTVQAIVASAPPRWNHLLTGPLGDNDGWLIPAALCVAALPLLRRKQRLTKSTKAALALWGGWGLLLFVFFSVGRGEHTYYVGALSPPIAATCGIGASYLWQSRNAQLLSRIVIGLVAMSTMLYALFLLPDRGAIADSEIGFPSWIAPLLIALAASVFVVVIASVTSRHARTRLTTFAAIAGLISVLAAPTIASINAVARGLGPPDYAFEPTYVSQLSVDLARQTIAGELHNEVAAFAVYANTPIMFATESSTLAALPIFLSGKEVLPIGGFLGAIREPTLATLQHDIATGQLRYFQFGVPASHDARIVWVRAHCTPVRHSDSNYACTPADVNHR